MLAPPSLETVWNNLRDELLRFLINQVGENNAEDLLHDIFVRLMRQNQVLAGKTSPRAWLYQVARNAVTDQWRRRRQTVELPADLRSTESSLTAAIESKLAACLRPLVDDLPARYADVLRLTELDGVPQAEAARRLRISVTALKSRVRRGRARLRAALMDCCHFEFSRTGRVLDYRPRGSCCMLG